MRESSDGGASREAAPPSAERGRAPPAVLTPRTLLRRTLAISGILLAWLLVVGSSPLWVPVALVVDLVRPRPALCLRFGAFLAWALSVELFALAIILVFWVAGAVLRPSPERYRRWHFWLQRVWARAHFRGTQRIFGFRVEVEEPDSLGEGPLLLFIRHASIGDTLLPTVFIETPLGTPLRYVFKRELLWEPCLDIVGNRRRMAFVDRYSDDPSRQVELVKRLTEDLDPTEGVLIYPEGTRPTPERRARALRRLRERDPELARWAEHYRTVLPPRPGGALGLLERNPGRDVVFCAHEGFDDVATLAAFAKGALVGRTIRLRTWRVPYAEIPADREARRSWLLEQWQRVDDWVTAARERRAEEEAEAPV